MKSLSFFLFIATLMLPQMSHAAFPNCEAAQNYGRNTSVLFSGMVYNRLDCNIEYIDFFESYIAGMGSNPLKTSDPDDIKVCYFVGYYGGLAELIPIEYGECSIENPDFFECIPIETIAMYAANVLIGADLSVADLSAANIHDIFLANPNYPICAETTAGSCAETIIDILIENPEFDDVYAKNLLIERLCP